MAGADVFQVGFLADFPGFIPEVAHWVWREWYQDRPDWDQERCEDRIRESECNKETPDVTFLALDAVKNAPAGIIQIIQDDELTGWRDKGPWLASGYVGPSYRGQGLLYRLIDFALNHAQSIGIDRLYFYTALPQRNSLSGRLVSRERTGICPFTGAAVSVFSVRP